MREFETATSSFEFELRFQFFHRNEIGTSAGAYNANLKTIALNKKHETNQA